MPRKGYIAKRTIEPDPVYGSDLVTKFINSMMWQGKKSTAEGIFYKSLEKLQEKGGDEALKLFKKAVENAKPLLEVKTRRVGGANYQVPVEVRPIRRMALAMRWLREAAKKRSEKSMPLRLAGELMEAAEGRGGAVTVNFYDKDGIALDHRFIESEANKVNISLRTGCFCNPGAGEIALGISRVELDVCFTKPEHEDRLSIDDFRHCIDGKSSGAVRISVGMVTNFNDVQGLLAFARGLLG